MFSILQILCHIERLGTKVAQMPPLVDGLDGCYCDTAVSIIPTHDIVNTNFTSNHDLSLDFTPISKSVISFAKCV